MNAKSIFASLVRGDDGSVSTTYGPFLLLSALQPIFRRSPDETLEIEAFEGLVRTFRSGEPVSPAEFFGLVEPADIETTDSILRTIHILNTGRLNRSHARIFIKFHPGLFRTPIAMRQEVERIKLAGHEAGLSPDRIVCEISEKFGEDAHLIAAFTEHMRAIGFRIAIDDFGAGDSDLERLKHIRPDYVKFEPAWTRDFLENSAGMALLRVIVRQMQEDGIEPVFEGLEQSWQVQRCGELGVPLMQGYALARPQLAPTDFNSLFPEAPSAIEPAAAARTNALSSAPSPAHATIASARAKPARTFGRRRPALD
ncbi:EAL domain-containing protein [Rhizobium sp. LCM 4573]|uniref:EAL domain-containing protein n=1 Tax=Rhizobium sp. LCM 4573 TaxID=1848291 RepID=UPI0008DA4B51|nr:EAL domain-containing protein [Rhizobium sp. LCM 4573]OHV84309.1 diguanylate phosphodiesterase [Rhizobium sp. LCM 4573]